MNVDYWIDRCGRQEESMGWRDKKRSLKSIFALIISEGGEATNGDRKGLMDEHLKQYKNSHVEIADVFIRLASWMQREGFTFIKGLSVRDLNKNQPLSDDIFDIEMSIFRIYEHGSYTSARELYSTYAITTILAVCEKNDIPLEKIVRAKLGYNLNRPDHQLENREKPGGKNY